MKKNLITSITTTKKRQDNLNKAFITLKEEFIGIDSMLDEVKKSISLWYITPELIQRPVTISLWGMTGTGKTSVIRRLTELLEINNKTVFFDCAQESDSNSGRGIVSEISKLVGENTNNPSDIVIVLDEFQFARSITEDGFEDNKSSIRPLWSLIDSGIIQEIEFKYEITDLVGFIDDLEGFLSVNKVNYSMLNGKLQVERDIKFFLSELGLIHYEEFNNTNLEYLGNSSSKSKRSNKSNKPNLLKVLESRRERVILKYVNKFRPGLGREYLEKLNNCKNLLEFGKILSEVRGIVTKPFEYNCGKSLIFLLGNLDEAFVLASEISPDIDADIIHESTSNITISEIKTALLKRFRPEQIARFGNNIIKYPSLSKKTFELIIKKETDKLISNFSKQFNKSIIISDEIFKLLYKEGVYPTQGVRPVFTTINYILTPILSEIIQTFPNTEDNEKITISLNNPSDLEIKNLNLESVTIKISSNINILTSQVETKLPLGSLRVPENRKSRYIIAVHEVGHAILLMNRNKIYPRILVSVSTDMGGFCDVFDKMRSQEITSIYDLKSNIMVSLGGYLAERLIFEEEKCLLGSSNDLISAWDELSSAVYESGYFSPIRLSNYDIETNNCGIPLGFLNKTIDSDIEILMNELITQTKEILSSELNLLKEMALLLGKYGKLEENEIKNLVVNFGNTIKDEDMNPGDKEYNYYEQVLKDL